jgi:hypothetical protein
MNVQLDEALIAQIGQRQRGGSMPMLTLDERIAVNLFWRRGVHMTVLIEVFKCGKNTLYANCLTGGGAYASGTRGDHRSDRRTESLAPACYARHDSRRQRREQGAP